MNPYERNDSSGCHQPYPLQLLQSVFTTNHRTNTSAESGNLPSGTYTSAERILHPAHPNQQLKEARTAAALRMRQEAERVKAADFH